MSEKMNNEAAHVGPPPELSELDWISLKSDIHSSAAENKLTPGSRFYQKFKDNPFVPIGKSNY